MARKSKMSKGCKFFDPGSHVNVDLSTSEEKNREGKSDLDGATEGSKLVGESTSNSEIIVQSPDLNMGELSGDSDVNEHSAVASRFEQRENRRTGKDRLKRTVFVGNLPAWMTKKALCKLFRSALAKSKIDSADCKIESVRLRGAVPTTGGTSKQAKKRSSIRHEFAAGDKHAQIGFVVLTSTAGIPAALRLNGHFLAKDSADTGRHIRVDVCGRQNPSYNTHKSIFVGNLPFSTNEEEVRQVFQSFGKITNVRLVRDSITGAVKGIGFVEFEDSSSIPLVIRQAAMSSSVDGSDSNGLQDLMVGGRRLRVEAWKSIKKVKKTKQQQRNKLGSCQAHKSVGAGRNALRVPTNLKGTVARKQFVKRVLQKRSKRKQIGAATDDKAAVKLSKRGKFGLADGRKAKRRMSGSRK